MSWTFAIAAYQIGNFQDPDFPALFAEVFALRFLWREFYTPGNER